MIRIDKRRGYGMLPFMVALLAAAGIGLAVWSPGGPVETRAEGAGPSHPSEETVRIAPDPGQGSARSDRGHHDDSDWASLMKESSDLRVFHVEALKNPKSGGVTYADYAVNLCRVAETVTTGTGIDWQIADLPYGSPAPAIDPDPDVPAAVEDPTSYTRRNDAYRKMKAACQGFSDTELGFQSHQDLLYAARAQGDVLRHLADQAALAAQSADVAVRKTALAAILDNGDPLLISATLERLLMSSSAGRLTYWIDGNQVNVADSGVFHSVLQALPCRLGLPCDERQPDVLANCVGRGKCFADRISLIEDELPQAKRAEFWQRLEHMEVGVRTRETAQFIP